jgi:S1-C subfamily serine protease
MNPNDMNSNQPAPYGPPPAWAEPARYDAPRPEPPRRRWTVPVVGVVTVAALAAVGGTVAVEVAARQSQTVATSLGPTANTGPGDFSGYFGHRGWGGGTTNGGDTNGGDTNGQVPSQSGTTSVPSSITSAVDPTIVDINTTLGLQQAAAAGTGIVLTASGEILTNNHVIDGATAITATDVGNGRTYQATVVGYDRSRDLAVLQLQGASGLATASIGDSSALQAGATIAAIGNAGGTGGTPAAVSGSVVALNQSITASDEDGSNAEQLTGLIQIAAAIEPGDSGGPLVDGSGHVVGIDTAADNGGNGFAIPIDEATTVAAQIAAGRASSTVHIGATAFLGIAADPSGTSGGGVLVSGVVSGSPAERAGLTAGDTLRTLDGTALSSSTTLTTLLSGHHPGDRVTLTVTGSTGGQRTVTVSLATGPSA